MQQAGAPSTPEHETIFASQLTGEGAGHGGIEGGHAKEPQSLVNITLQGEGLQAHLGHGF